MSQYKVASAPAISALQRKCDLMCCDRSLANDHPRIPAAGEIDDGGCGRPGSRTAVDDQWNLVPKLFSNAVCIGALRVSAQIGRGCRDRADRDAQPPRGRSQPSGTRSATLPVLAVTRSGSFDPALTMIVNGPGQNFSASRSNAVSISRASSYACATSAISRDNGLWRARVLIS